jgi:flagellar protein FlaG
MASVSVSHLIIFIAAMIVAASVAGLLTTTVNDISNAIEEQGFSTSDDIRSDITIINDPGAGVYNSSGSGNVTLYVKNTGSKELSAASGNIDVFVNGVFTTVSDGNITTLGSENWGRNDVVRITVSGENVNDPGQNRAKVVAGGGEDIFIWEQ